MAQKHPLIMEIRDQKKTNAPAESDKVFFCLKWGFPLIERQ